MQDTPLQYTDYAGSRSYAIHYNYLTGVTNGLRAILEAFNDVANQKNRNCFITPVIVADDAPPNGGRTLFDEFIPHDNETERTTYHNNEWDSSNMHLISAHLNKSLDGVGGHADISNPRDFFYMLWDMNQYQIPGIDNGDSNVVWGIAHELGHTLGRSHHTLHGADNVAGTSLPDCMNGTDCLMTQAPCPPTPTPCDPCKGSPSINTNGQSAKRFGPSCVRAIRDRISNSAGLE